MHIDGSPPLLADLHVPTQVSELTVPASLVGDMLCCVMSTAIIMSTHENMNCQWRIQRGCQGFPFEPNYSTEEPLRLLSTLQPPF